MRRRAAGDPAPAWGSEGAGRPARDDGQSWTSYYRRRRRRDPPGATP